jgi:hypothetical protein
MTLPRFIDIGGKLYLWRDILALRRAQIEACARAEQAALFQLVDDHRPETQATAAGRYTEPQLFNL